MVICVVTGSTTNFPIVRACRNFIILISKDLFNISIMKENQTSSRRYEVSIFDWNCEKHFVLTPSCQVTPRMSLEERSVSEDPYSFYDFWFLLLSFCFIGHPFWSGYVNWLGRWGMTLYTGFLDEKVLRFMTFQRRRRGVTKSDSGHLYECNVRLLCSEVRREKSENGWIWTKPLSYRSAFLTSITPNKYTFQSYFHS